MITDNMSIHVETDYMSGLIKIYWKERIGNRTAWYNFNGDELVLTEFKEGIVPVGTKPFLAMPIGIGKAFLSLIYDEVSALGINQKKVDMQAGKSELLESELAFNKQQLVKLIDHFLK